MELLSETSNLDNLSADMPISGWSGRAPMELLSETSDVGIDLSSDMSISGWSGGAPMELLSETSDVGIDLSSDMSISGWSGGATKVHLMRLQIML
jgi:hypothetical protein